MKYKTPACPVCKHVIHEGRCTAIIENSDWIQCECEAGGNNS